MPAGRKLADWNFEFRMGEANVFGRRDEVRLEVGDIDPEFNLIEDKVITWRLSQEANHILKAAWRVAGDIKRRFAKYVDKNGQNYNEELSKVFERYEEIEKSLLHRKGLRVPSAVQISKSRREDLRTDTDLPAPAFTVGQLSEDTVPLRGGGSELEDPATELN